MKIRALLLLSGLMLGTTLTVSAQNDFGADSAACVKQLFLYQEFTKQKSWTDALVPWEKAIEMCPGSRKSLYTKGKKMFKALLKEEKDEAARAALIDKLMMMYDTRMSAFEGNSFGDPAYVKGLKGVDYYKYNKKNHVEAMEMLKEAVDLGGNKTKASALASYYKAIYNSYKEEKTSVDVMLNEYTRVSDIINHNLETLDKTDEKQAKLYSNYMTTKDNVDTYFIAVAKCEDIVPLFQEKITAAPDDMELKKKALSILNRKNCLENDLFLQVAEPVHAAEPTWESAQSIAKVKLKNGDITGALQYFDEAVQLCGDCAEKITLLTNTGLLAVSKGQTGKAAGYANDILAAEPNNGTAYIIKGDVVRSKAGACDDGKVGKLSVYWKAVDYYMKAMSVDPSDKVKESANKKIASCKRQYPTKADLFFHGLKAGDSYTLPCTGETTTVRQSD